MAADPAAGSGAGVPGQRLPAETFPGRPIEPSPLEPAPPQPTPPTLTGPTLTDRGPLPEDPAAGPARVIRPSVVHVPASLLPLIVAERQRSGRSNGQILIDAIEAGHEHLVKLHNESNSIGGRLFTARTAKPRLPVAQPLSPLNIRLYEQDYEVLDRLVDELGAGSRSRLATLALARYLDGSA
ncbi:hypothetical protein [Jiangella asiatica]|uniref:Ribbon-helix-helix protein, CopG family n=1 Tax=Jiangella asiatica TaxID=2530372 RepID=A0A4R5DKT6_9ACTN|nr:hypothetical protein [Jiangella asiatica]TDE12591.1 hypothetical protein E1269_07045 [Jiangella asiatica]